MTAIVETAKPESALLIPQQAVQIDQTGRYVLKVDADNKVQVQRITVGEQRDGAYVVTNGLQLGERVITEGLQKVRPGMVVDPGEAPHAAGGRVGHRICCPRSSSTGRGCRSSSRW